MNLTGQQLIEQGIVTGPVLKENIAQHGVDLNIASIKLIDGLDDPGYIPREGKTQLSKRRSIPLQLTGDNPFWHLTPGAYEIDLVQGCKVPADKMLLIRQRSSLLRNGAIIHSSVFDAGFETDHIGTVMIVTTPIRIESGARVCQIYAHNSNLVENLYDGQWQGDKQRDQKTS